MHGSAGLHSAMAIKRQRRFREQAKRKAKEHKERRLSTSTMDSMEFLPKKVTHAGPADPSSIGMLHIGVCFLALGTFLLASGLLPTKMVSWRGGGWFNELVITGLFVIILGVFLICLNSIVGKREEDDLNNYVQSQLTRSRSGHRLEVDAETGCLTTKNTRRHLERKREDRERGIHDVPAVHVHSPQMTTFPTNGTVNGELYLEKILEEDVIEKNEIGRNEYEVFNKETMSTTTTASLSPGTPSETRELLSNGKHNYYRPY